VRDHCADGLLLDDPIARARQREHRAVFETNFFGTVRMVRAVVPHMRRQGEGRIVNIASIFGFMPAPFMALYAATKHAVEGYSDSLDHELRTMGIRVSAIEPANTNTQFDANLLDADAKLDAYREGRTIVAKRLTEMVTTGTHPASWRKRSSKR
jgi:short-subunit dehydrogenase